MAMVLTVRDPEPESGGACEGGGGGGWLNLYAKAITSLEKLLPLSLSLEHTVQTHGPPSQSKVEMPAAGTPLGNRAHVGPLTQQNCQTNLHVSCLLSPIKWVFQSFLEQRALDSSVFHWRLVSQQTIVYNTSRNRPSNQRRIILSL